MIIIQGLVWDSWNVAHIARHGVTPEEVEEVCQGSYLTFDAYGERIVLVGTTRAGRNLTAVLAAKRKGIYYPVTARPSSRKERRYYRQQKGGDKAA